MPRPGRREGRERFRPRLACGRPNVCPSAASYLTLAPPRGVCLKCRLLPPPVLSPQIEDREVASHKSVVRRGGRAPEEAAAVGGGPGCGGSEGQGLNRWVPQLQKVPNHCRLAKSKTLSAKHPCGRDVASRFGAPSLPLWELTDPDGLPPHSWEGKDCEVDQVLAQWKTHCFFSSFCTVC